MRQPCIVIALASALACEPAATRSPAPRAEAHVEVSTGSAMPVPFEADDGRFGYRDASGRELLPPRYALAQAFSSSGVAFVVDERGWACIDTAGAVRLRPFVFDNGPDYPSEGLFRYVDGARIGFADPGCQVVIPAAWEFAGPFAESRAPACRGCTPARGEHGMPSGGRWGFIDRSGREVIALEWDFVFPFEHGTATVERDGSTRTIDLDGAVLPASS